MKTEMRPPYRLAASVKCKNIAPISNSSQTMLKKLLFQFAGNFIEKHDRRKIVEKILYSDSFDYSIKNASYVNSWTTLFACDIHPKDPMASQKDIHYVDSIPNQLNDLTTLGSHQHIPTIYVQTTWLTYFSKSVLPKITCLFVLVSGDNDLPVDRHILGEELENILNCPYLVKWFAQNKDVEHPKLQTLPIGINLYNLWMDPLQWGGGFILPAMQELQLKTISENAAAFSDRKPEIFCNWHFSLDRGDRKHCLELINKSICYFQPQPKPVIDTWALQSQYQFVLSPHGAGLDCFRTWEALILGCIPIVKKARMNDVFKDLPIIEVEDWRQLNADFLASAKSALEKKVFNLEKLTMRYWRNQIRQP